MREIKSLKINHSRYLNIFKIKTEIYKIVRVL